VPIKIPSSISTKKKGSTADAKDLNKLPIGESYEKYPFNSFFICIAQVVQNTLQADLCARVARKYLLLFSLQNYYIRCKYFLIVTYSM